MNRSKKLLLFFFVCLALFGLVRVYDHVTDDFRIANIRYLPPFAFEKPLPVISSDEHDRILEILEGKLTYIGKGAQSYVFRSEDGRYVLKAVKFKHLKPSVLAMILPPIYPFTLYTDKCAARKKRKLLDLFNSYHLAFESNRKASALVYAHLSKGEFPGQTVNLVDKIGFTRKVDLNDIYFLIQKKGETSKDRISGLLASGRIEEAKQTLTRLLEMYRSEYLRGLYDPDHAVMQNTGFIGDDPFHLDVGQLTADKEMVNVDRHRIDLKQILWKIHRWLKEAFPLYSNELTVYMEEQFYDMTGETVDLDTLVASDFPRRRHD